MSDEVADDWNDVNVTGGTPPQKKRVFSIRAFMLTLGGGLALYGALALWLFQAAPDTIAHMQSNIATRTVVITGDAPDEREIAEPEITDEPPFDDHEDIAEEKEIKQGVRSYPNGLPMHPIQGLHEDSADGPLPVIRDADGLSAFNAYRARSPALAHATKKIAIILSDYGLSAAASEAALRTLPEYITLALSPYAANLDLWMNEARVRGHEVWMMLPTETQTYPASDSGPHSLLSHAALHDNQSKLNWLMGRTTGYVGFITAPDSVFLESLNDARPVLNSFFLRGLGMIDGKPSTMGGNAMPPALAAGLKAPYGRADVLIGPDNAPDNIAAQLTALESRARQNGYAIGVMRPSPATYQAIEKWADTLAPRGMALVPASALAAPQTGSQ